MARKKTAKTKAKAKTKKAAPKRTRGKAPADQTVAAHLAVDDGAAAMDFYARAFGAKEIYRITEPGSVRIAHAETRIGNSIVIVADDQPQVGAFSPTKYGGSPITMNLRVRDADAAVAKAVAAGGKLFMPPLDLHVSGQRMGGVEDPFGYKWFITAKVEKITARESQRRMNATAPKNLPQVKPPSA